MWHWWASKVIIHSLVFPIFWSVNICIFSKKILFFIHFYHWKHRNNESTRHHKQSLDKTSAQNVKFTLILIPWYFYFPLEHFNNLNTSSFNFWRTSILFVGPLIPLFWTSGVICPGFQSQGRFLACMLCHLHATVSSDSPLAWHLLISWQPAWQLSYSDPHTCKQKLVGLKSGSLSELRVFFLNFLFPRTKCQNLKSSFGK